MITSEEYFRKPHSAKQAADARDLLRRVCELGNHAVGARVFAWIDDPDTGCCISGTPGGDGDGGFRTPGSKTGAPDSSHRHATGVDVYDPGDKLDAWINDAILEQYGLYREHPSATPGWCHLTTRAPKSGKRTFHP